MLYLPSFNIITIQYNNIAFLFLNRRKITQSNTMHEYVRNLVTKKKAHAVHRVHIACQLMLEHVRVHVPLPAALSKLVSHNVCIECSRMPIFFLYIYLLHKPYF